MFLQGAVSDMKVGDLVRLEYKDVDLDEKDRKKIGIVKTLTQANIGLIKVLWSSGEQTWCLCKQLEVLA